MAWSQEGMVHVQRIAADHEGGCEEEEGAFELHGELNVDFF